MANNALDCIDRRYRRLGLLFGVPASLFRWLPVDTDILSDFWRVYDKHGRKLPSPDAGADVADISVDACYENARFYHCDAGVLCCSTRRSKRVPSDVYFELSDIFDL